MQGNGLSLKTYEDAAPFRIDKQIVVESEQLQPKAKAVRPLRHRLATSGGWLAIAAGVGRLFLL